MKRINIMSLSLLILLTGFLLLGGLQEEVIAEDAVQHEKISLSIEGMTCSSCTKKVKKALMNVPGVEEADVTLKRKTWWNPWSATEGKAIVEFESGAVAVDQLIEIIEKSSDAMYTYTASLLSIQQRD
ncbi:MAG: heavy-metal-associated domain-containing protein [bacterium]